MQLSKPTLETLKNFAGIYEGLSVKKGNTLRTVSKGKTILAQAVVDESFPIDFAIADLNQVLAILSLHKDAADLSVKGNDLVITGVQGRSKITYRCCDTSMIKTPPEQNISLPSKDVTFLLTEEDLDWVLRSGSVLASPNIAAVRTNGTLSLRLFDGQNDSAHTDTLDIEKQEGPDCFFMFKLENWKMLPGTYEVTISSKGVSHFKSTTRKIEYWVALEQKAK